MPKKLTSFGEIGMILRKERPGRIYIPGNANLCRPLEAEIQKYKKLPGAEKLRVFQLLSLGKGWKATTSDICMETPFAGGEVRDLINEGMAKYYSCHLSELAKLLDRHLCPDIAFMHVSPPNKNGVVTLGLDAGISHAAYKAAKNNGTMLIAIINHKMPRFHVESLGVFDGQELRTGCPANLDDFHSAIEIEEDLMTHSMGIIDDISEAIGGHVASLSQNGDTLQFGIGGIPNAVARALSQRGRSNLGVHSELISDGTLNLIESGALNGSRKTFAHGKHVLGFALGSKNLYDRLSDESIAILPQDVVNDPRIVSKNTNMMNVNSTLYLSLKGDACASVVIGKDGRVRIVSGVGGARDFSLGADMSSGGRSIIAFPSTYIDKNGELQSRIVPYLPEGAHVTTSSDTLHYAATEYGVVELFGKSDDERARALIDIAHPKLRDRLSKGLSLMPGFQGHYLAA